MNNSIRSRRGVALLLTLLVVTIMILTVGQISYTTKVEVKIAENFKDDLQNLKAAQAGVHFAHAFLRIDAKEKEAEEQYYHSLKDGWASGIESQAVGKSQLTIDLKDEERKFNILKLVQGSPDEKLKSKEQFIRLVDFLFEDKSFDTEGFTNAITTWMNNFYDERKDRKLNKSLYTLREIELIPELLTTYFPKDQEASRSYSLETLYAEITFISSKKININTASVSVLRCLHKDIPDEFLSLILGRRELEEEGEGYYKSITQLEEDLDIADDEERKKIFDEIRNELTTQSDHFSAILTSTNQSLTRRYRAYYSHTKEKTSLIHWELLEQ